MKALKNKLSSRKNKHFKSKKGEKEGHENKAIQNTLKWFPEKPIVEKKD